jgi:hypothetical protein
MISQDLSDRIQHLTSGERIDLTLRDGTKKSGFFEARTLGTITMKHITTGERQNVQENEIAYFAPPRLTFTLKLYRPH